MSRLLLGNQKIVRDAYFIDTLWTVLVLALIFGAYGLLPEASPSDIEMGLAAATGVALLCRYLSAWRSGLRKNEQDVSLPALVVTMEILVVVVQIALLVRVWALSKLFYDSGEVVLSFSIWGVVLLLVLIPLLLSFVLARRLWDAA